MTHQKKCLSEEGVAALADGSLSAEERETLEMHLEECAACRREVLDVLALVEPAGPACHTGEDTCFGDGAEGPWEATLPELWRTIEARARELPEGSYTTRLLTSENLRLKKLGEELVELVSAIASGEAAHTREETADLFYHLLVAVKGAGLTLSDVLDTLEDRKG